MKYYVAYDERTNKIQGVHEKKSILEEFILQRRADGVILSCAKLKKKKKKKYRKLGYLDEYYLVSVMGNWYPAILEKDAIDAFLDEQVQFRMTMECISSYDQNLTKKDHRTLREAKWILESLYQESKDKIPLEVLETRQEQRREYERKVNYE